MSIVVDCVLALIILVNIWKCEDRIIHALRKRDEEEPK